MNLRIRNLRTRNRGRLHGRSLRTRLLLFISATLFVVCAAMSLTTVLVQRAYLLGDLDDRVGNAAERSLGGAEHHPDFDGDLGFLMENGHAVGTLAARFDDKGSVIAAAVVSQDAPPQNLTTAQREALAGITADGAMHTRTVPGFGTYRLTALNHNGVKVLTGLPMDDVQDMISGLVVAEAVVALAGLTVAGCLCAVVIRRQLRPLGRVAATAVEVSRSQLGHGEVTALTRVPERDTDPGSEAGQVGAALNRMIDHVESSLAERQRSEEQMRRSEERMRRFLADASHELRTPLASIAGYAELMNRGTDRIEPGLAWRRVTAESARMTGLVEDLLLLARLDEGRPCSPPRWTSRRCSPRRCGTPERPAPATTGSSNCPWTPRRWSSATRPACTRCWPTCWPTRVCTPPSARRSRRASRPPPPAPSQSGYATTARASPGPPPHGLRTLHPRRRLPRPRRRQGGRLRPRPRHRDGDHRSPRRPHRRDQRPGPHGVHHRTPRRRHRTPARRTGDARTDGAGLEEHRAPDGRASPSSP